MKRLAWAGCFALAGCSALSNPVLGPTGEPQVNPDGTERVVYDEVTGTLGTLAGVIGGNPLWVTLVGAGGALLRGKVVKPVA